MTIEEWANAKLYTEESCGTYCFGMINAYKIIDNRHVEFTFEYGLIPGTICQTQKFFKKYEVMTVEEFNQLNNKKDVREEYAQYKRDREQEVLEYLQEILNSDLEQFEKLFLLASVYQMFLQSSSQDWLIPIAKFAGMTYTDASALRFGKLETAFGRLQNNKKIFDKPIYSRDYAAVKLVRLPKWMSEYPHNEHDYSHFLNKEAIIIDIDNEKNSEQQFSIKLISPTMYFTCHKEDLIFEE